MVQLESLRALSAIAIDWVRIISSFRSNPLETERQKTDGGHYKSSFNSFTKF